MTNFLFTELPELKKAWDDLDRSLWKLEKIIDEKLEEKDRKGTNLNEDFELELIVLVIAYSELCMRRADKIKESV